MKPATIQKYDYIDALRGIAIIAVVLAHSSQWVGAQSDVLASIATQGAKGVQLFFVASALTIFLSMRVRRDTEAHPLLNFYLRRFFRIAPAFYLAIVFYTLLNGFESRYSAPNGIDWWYFPVTAAFLHGLHPETINAIVPGGWSIAVEFTFYLIAPLLFTRLQSGKSIVIFLLISYAVARSLPDHVATLLEPLYEEPQVYIVHNFTDLFFFSQLPIFVLGILAFHIITKHPVKTKKTNIYLAIAFFFIVVKFIDSGISQSHYSYGLYCLFLTVTLYYYPVKALVNPVTVFIGRLSFSIYLIHFAVITLFKYFFSEALPGKDNFLFFVVFAVILTASTFLAYFAHKFIEEPGIRLGKNIIAKIG